jgi:hypothetical protein
MGMDAWIAATTLADRIQAPKGLDAFSIALTCHIVGGLAAVTCGALAATAPKRRGRHPVFGRIYLWSMGVVFMTAVTMGALRWPRDAHLVAIGTIAAAAAAIGYVARRRRRPGWMRWHIVGMATSYVALFTGFYVDNGPNLPLWDRLPPISFWVLPSLVGLPLTLRALARRRRPELSSKAS